MYTMLFQTYGDRKNPAVLFFHAMGVTGAEWRAGCEIFTEYDISAFYLPPPCTAKGRNMSARQDEVRQVEEYLKSTGS